MTEVRIETLRIMAGGRFYFGIALEGISELVVSAARNTSFTVGKSSIPDLTDLVPMYDTMFEKLYQYTRSWPFTQARLTIFYHFSIIHAAQRLREGVPRQDACPPYQGYGTHKAGGLFVCRQEYEDVFFRRAVGQLQEQPFDLPELIRLSGQKEHINLEDVIEALARLNACGSIECDVPGCSSYRYDFGWHILGSDTGCCGDYPSCCVFADSICFFHDILCRCCSYFVCPEPYCKPAPSCPNATIV
ncbi:uncharacterized protein LOC110977626 isoform X2 [Acanthaster planci]|uniref:Uncharacterized protein LOC110977626 isoform X2 n=1 Tax=Acanthaster planci TaxID=133434 RepID=A0A8B7Y5I8_ACAPL|nr:uncharacterized protein LOC110977626 isoform X2 [Acanthaster planci]